MGLKGFRLWARGQMNFQRPEPHRGVPAQAVSHCVKANVEAKILSLYRFKGWFTKPGGAFKRYGSTGFNGCTTRSPPWC
jgi:hypothetical protein